jgi:hypothetical protein
MKSKGDFITDRFYPLIENNKGKNHNVMKNESLGGLVRFDDDAQEGISVGAVEISFMYKGNLSAMWLVFP